MLAIKKCQCTRTVQRLSCLRQKLAVAKKKARSLSIHVQSDRLFEFIGYVCSKILYLKNELFRVTATCHISANGLLSVFDDFLEFSQK